MTLQIVGAGMAGLLAANMLRHRDPVLIERQPSLPNNHSAVLRFRTPIVGDVLNIPFKKVTMIKTHVPWRNPVADALAYSFKNGSSYRSDRSIIAGTTVAERYIAPPNLIQRMFTAPLRAQFNATFDVLVDAKNNPTISTMPMEALMTLLDYKDKPNFEYVSGHNITATIESCDAYVSLLIPDPKIKASRASITGNELIIEIPQMNYQNDKPHQAIIETCHLLGIDHLRVHNAAIHTQRYAKIMPIDDAVRKNFMHWATDKFNIFSLGRFATWRPGLLLDDLVNDIRKIDRWITDGKYAIARDR